MGFNFKRCFQSVLYSCVRVGVVGLGVVALLSDPAGAQSFEAPPKPIHITSDQLISDTENHQAEFVGNVIVIQGDTRITTDRLKIFFSAQTPGKETSPTQSMEKLLATGNVNIKFDNKLAVAREALYIMQKQVLILTGPGATVTSGNNVITGDKITFYRNDGRFTVEGKTGSPVRATLLPEESGKP